MSTQSDLGTISTLLGDALSQSAKLFQNEVDLAKAELGEKLQQVGWAIGFFAAAAVLVIPALVMALFALSAALMEAGWSQPSSYLVSAVVAAAVAGALFAVGLNRLDARNLAPRETMRQLEKDKVTVKEMVQMSNFLDNLKEAVRENPLSAALIGGGALWLLIGNERLKNAAASASAATAPLADIGAKSAVERAQIHEQSADRSGNRPRIIAARRHIGCARPRARHQRLHPAPQTRSKIGSEKGLLTRRESLSKAAEALPPKETMAKVQSSLSDLLERQPLVLGAIGLAVGVAVAGAFTASDLENEWVGEVSDRVKEDLKARAGAVSQSAREASDTLKAELGDIGSEAADRLHEAGRNAMNAARGKASA